MGKPYMYRKNTRKRVTARKAFSAFVLVTLVFTVLSFGPEGMKAGAAEYSSVQTASSGTEMAEGYDRALPDGDYLIKSYKNPSFQLNISGDSIPAAAGTDVNLWEVWETDVFRAQDLFTIKYDPSDKCYSIKQKDTNMSLDVENASVYEGANVQVYPYNGGSGQKWAINPRFINGERYGYRLQAKCSGYSLDIEGANTDSNGTNVRMWTNNNTDAQAWMFIPYEAGRPIKDGRYIIVSALDPNLEVDVYGDYNNVADGTDVQIWHDNIDEYKTKALSQYNSFDIHYVGEGYYRLDHAGSGKALSVSYNSKECHANVLLWGIYDAPTEGQIWAITPVDGGYMLRAKCSGQALDVMNAKTYNGTNVNQYPVNYQKCQTWSFVPAEYQVTYNANGGTNAPAAQTKYYKGDIILSSVIPTQTNYKFLGWSASKDATSAQYQPGDKYTTDKNIQLYAVWMQNSRIPGDVNNDGKVTTMDATLIKRYIVGGYSIPVFNLSNADVNGDGKVTTMDATLIKRYIVGGYGVVLK